MPLLKCRNCMHEWEGKSDSKCAWCGCKGRILEEKTAFEKYVADMKEVQKDIENLLHLIPLDATPKERLAIIHNYFLND